METASTPGIFRRGFWVRSALLTLCAPLLLAQSPLLPGHNRQYYVGWMVTVMQYCLMCYCQLYIYTKIVPCIGIAVPARETTACHIQANAMPGLEDVTG